MNSVGADVKIFLRNDGEVEARRFVFPPGIIVDFSLFKEQLKSHFPILNEVDYKLTWKDSDGDHITIATSAELATAFHEMTGAVKVFYITVLQRRFEPDLVIEADIPTRSCNVICDGCEKRITGYRYKCLQCPDYDLCIDCEGKGQHPQHMMLRIAHGGIPLPRCSRKLMSHFNRSMRRNASREAHRASRHCGEQAAGTNSAQAQEGAREGADAGANAETRCDADVNLNDLQELARQHLAPLLQAFAPPSGNSRSTEEAPAFADLIRNAVDGFFGVGRGAGGAGSQEQPASGKQTQQPTAQPAAQPTPQPTPQNGASAPGTQPMEGVENGDGKAVSAEQRRPEGWIVIDDDHAEPHSNGVANNATTPQGNPPNAQNEDPRIARALAQLQEMGFSNQTDALRDLLVHYNGNVEPVLRTILENQ